MKRIEYEEHMREGYIRMCQERVVGLPPHSCSGSLALKPFLCRSIESPQISIHYRPSPSLSQGEARATASLNPME